MSRGFTLLEVLVAVAILAVAMTAIMQSFSQGFFTLRKTENYAIATMYAQSKLAEIGPLIPIEPGFHNGEYERGFDWSVEIREAPLPVPTNSRSLGDPNDESNGIKAYSVTVSVGWDEDQSLRLNTIKLAVDRR